MHVDATGVISYTCRAKEEVMREKRLADLKAAFREEPYAKFLRMEVEELKEGFVRARATAHEEMVVKMAGVVQGGVTASVMDFAGVLAAISMLDEGHTPLKSWDIHCTQPVHDLDELHVEAQVLNESRAGIFVFVSVTRGKEQVSYGTLTFAKPKANGH